MDTIRKLTDTMAKDGDQAMERAHDVAQSVLDKSRETLKELRGQGQDAIEQVQKSSQQAWEDTRKLVQKHPAKSMGIALLAGAVIGGIMMALRNKE